MKIPIITEEQFKTYESIRKSGKCNMFAIITVKNIANKNYHIRLVKDEIMEIMRRYSHYKEFFKEKRDKRLDKLNHEKLK